jgi:hypothetical protein
MEIQEREAGMYKPVQVQPTGLQELMQRGQSAGVRRPLGHIQHDAGGDECVLVSK